MKRVILLLLVGAFVALAAGCDAAAGMSGEVIDTIKVPEVDAEADTEAEATDVAARSIAEVPSVSVEPVATPEPVFGTAADGDIVPIETATPVPSDVQDSFSYDGDDSITVEYYDMEQQQTVETSYPVADPTDPLAVVEGVTSSLKDVLGDERIQVSSTNYSDGNLFVDFDPSIYDLGLASGDENQILNSIADTYLGNVDGIRAVYYTVAGEPYTSAHTQLAPNEAFKTIDAYNAENS